ncbi:MAG: RNA polymerase sigma factor [Saprospiraceae bacterium]|nr:RNA polymerase sigma factor [Saprospiraceae bacterium]
MTEFELIQGCLNEDRRAQRELFSRYAGKMMTVCLRYARHRMEAEDLLQDAFIKIFDNIQSFEGKGSFEGWIRRIVVNTALKNISKHSFQKEGIGLDNVVETWEDPSVFSQLSEQELISMISGLPNGYRICFNLYVIEGFSHREIAEMLDIEESTSRSQLVKARNMLQNMVLKSQKVTK